VNDSKIIRLINRSGDRLTRAIELVLAVAFVSAVGINFVNVVDRYVFGDTFLGADEVQIYIMICMAFLGAAVVTWRDRHLRMDVLVRCVPVAAQRLVHALETIIFFVVTVFVAIESFLYAAKMFTLGQTSDMARIPMWLPHGAIVLGFALMAVMALYAGAKAAFGRQLESLSTDPRSGEGADS
jgi:TRAP-type C4-dicarboxylate transport system permease small subunit